MVHSLDASPMFVCIIHDSNATSVIEGIQMSVNKRGQDLTGHSVWRHEERLGMTIMKSLRHTEWEKGGYLTSSA
jgi:hypothetical protein